MTENTQVETQLIEQSTSAVVPIGNIKLQLGDQALFFTPADDITAKEVALIFQMFLNGLMQKSNVYLDFASYINALNLGRHFKEAVDEFEKSQETSKSD